MRISDAKPQNKDGGSFKARQGEKKRQETPHARAPLQRKMAALRSLWRLRAPSGLWLQGIGRGTAPSR